MFNLFVFLLLLFRSLEVIAGLESNSKIFTIYVHGLLQLQVSPCRLGITGLLGRLWSYLLARLNSHQEVGKFFLTFFLRLMKLNALRGVTREGQEEEQKLGLGCTFSS